MKRFLEPYSDLIYGVMRVVVGFLFWSHGAGKILGLFGGRMREWTTLSGFAGLVEVVAGIFIMVGLFTSFTAFICSGQMAFAYFLSHAPDGTWPIQNGGELAAVYSFVFLYIAAHGGGGYSLDAVLQRRSQKAMASI